MIDIYLHDIPVAYGLDPALVKAIATVESNLDPNACRYEPHWRYHSLVNDYAKSLGITRETEKVMQATSWGLMQIMGTVARELGYLGHLHLLCDPQANLVFGCRKLEELFQRYPNRDDVISAYNQGWPKKNSDGTYANQVYVNKVKDLL